MIKFTESEMSNILQKIRNREQISITESYHFLENTKFENTRRKYCEHDKVCQTIKTDIPLKIKYSENNKFRVTYKHPYNNKYDLVIVIFIKEINDIKLITAFPENKKEINKMREVKPINYKYDSSADALMIRVPNYEHEESVPLNNNLIVDFNKDNEFIALEILDASHVLNTNKHSLQRISNINLRVIVTKDQIFISSIFVLPVRNADVVRETNASTVNDINIPVMETELATA